MSDFELIDSVSFFLFTCILYFLSILSKRLGEVMGMKKYYYIYYLSMLFTLSGSFSMSLILFKIENTEFFSYAFFATGLTLGMFVTIRYWGWLIKELFRG